MDSHSGRLKTLKASADLLIYASILLGVALLVQLYSLAPLWLFYSVLAGWITYLIVAGAIARGFKMAYPLSLVLAILTLAVSLPQPEHFSLVQAGLSPASLAFIAGSVLQVAVILTVSSYLILTVSSYLILTVSSYLILTRGDRAHVH